MGQRLGPIAQNVNWMAPHALAAQLQAQAGESLGRGYASFGQSIGQGLTNLGNNRREEKRFNTLRQDRLAEQAKIDARRDEQMTWERSKYANSVLMERLQQVAERANAAGMAGDEQGLQTAMSEAERIQSSIDANTSRMTGVQGIAPGQDFGDLPKPPPIPEQKMVPGVNAPASSPEQAGGVPEAARASAKRLETELRLQMVTKALANAKDPEAIATLRTSLGNLTLELELAKAREKAAGGQSEEDPVRARQVASDQDEIARAKAVAKAKGWDFAGADDIALPDLVKQKLSVETAGEKGDDTQARRDAAWEKRRAARLEDAKAVGLDKSPEFLALDREADNAVRAESDAQTAWMSLLRATNQPDAPAVVEANQAWLEARKRRDFAEGDVARYLRHGEMGKGSLEGGMGGAVPVETPGSVAAPEAAPAAPAETGSRVAERLKALRGG